MSVTITPASSSHRAKWEELYAGYAEFYRVQQTAAMRETVWGWINDPLHEVECLLALNDSGEPVGFAHFRAFARPLAASTGGFLDDLFVEEDARGSGAALALLEGLEEIAHERGWSVVRWITADDNYRARGLYDRVATRTPWLTYDLTP